jgi:hypothetical protein
MRPKTTHRVAFSSVVCVAFVCLATALPARAEFVNPLIRIDLEANGMTGSWELEVTDPSDPFSWNLTAPVEIYSDDPSETYLGTIETLNLGLDGDPQVLLNFSMTAGPAPTLFSVSTGLVLFAPINNPLAFATAAITVTDNNSNGGTATGTFPGSKAYQASYNGGSTFANLVSPVVAPLDDSATGSERLPAVGSVVIPGVVTSINAEYSFLLTAADSASGTSRFNVIVPEPSTIVLALAGLAALFWHRRRK